MEYYKLTIEQMNHLKKMGLKLKDTSDYILNDSSKTLSMDDILENYLPKELHIDERYYRLVIEYNTYTNKWFVTYEDIDCYIVISRQDKLISCIFDILCWCIENNYLI